VLDSCPKQYELDVRLLQKRYQEAIGRSGPVPVLLQVKQDRPGLRKVMVIRFDDAQVNPGTSESQ